MSQSSTIEKLPRNTFGILDPSTGKKYEDIIGSHLQLRRLSLEEWLEVGYIAESKDRQKLYKILLDFATQRELLQKNLIEVLVSFQVRTDGCYAVARLFDVNKKGNQYAL